MTSRFALSTVLKTVLAVLSVVTFASVSLAQDVPHKVSYQGLLTDGAGQPIADGDHVATFTLYTDAAGTTTYWTSTFHITTSQGIFNVVLGDSGTTLPTPLMLPMWLGVKVENGTELRPLTQVVSAPYALGIVDSAVSTSKIQDGAVTREKMGQDFVGHVTLNRGQFATQKGKDVDFTVGTNLNLRVDTTNGQVHAIIDALGGGTLNEVRVDPQGGLVITAGGGNANFVTLAIGAQGVQTYMIRDKAVDSTKLADGSVNSRTIQDGSVTGTDIASNTITGNNIKDGTIQGVDIAIPLILTRSTPGDVLDVTNTSDNTGGVSVVNFQGNSSDGTSVVGINGDINGGSLVTLTQTNTNGTGLAVTSTGTGIISNATNGPAVLGTTNGFQYAVVGNSSNNFAGAAGVQGVANNGSSNTQYGVYGTTNSLGSSAGVWGAYTGTSTTGAGVLGNGGNGWGVYGSSTGRSAIRGTTSAANWAGLHAINTASSNGYGILADVSGAGSTGMLVGIPSSSPAYTGLGYPETGVSVNATSVGLNVNNGVATGLAIGTTTTGGITVGATAGTTNVTINGAASNAVNVTGSAPTGILVNSTGTTGVSVSNNTTGVSVSGGTTGVSATGQTGSSFVGQNNSTSATGTLQNQGTGSALTAQNSSSTNTTVAITNNSATGWNALTAQNNSATSATATFTNTLASGAGAIQANNNGTLATITANNAYTGGGVSLGGVARFTNSNNNGKSHSTLTLGNSIAGPASNNYALVVTDGIVDLSSTNTVVLAPNLAAQVTIVNPPSGSPSNSLLVTATAPTGVNVTGATGTGFATAGAVTGANISGTTTGVNANVTGTATAIAATAVTGSAINATNNSSSNPTLSVTNSAAGQTAISASGNISIPANGSVQVLSNAASTFGTSATDATKLNVVGLITTPGSTGVPVAQSELFVNGDANIAGTVTANNVYVLGTLVLPPGAISSLDSVTINKAGVRRLTVGIAGTASTTEFNVMAGATTNIFGPMNVGTALVPSTSQFFGSTTINGGTSTSGTQIGNSNSTTTVTGPTNINITGTSTTTIGSTNGTTNVNGTTTVTGATTINGGTSGSTTTIGNTTSGGNVNINAAAANSVTVTGPTNINTIGTQPTAIGSTGSGGNITLNAASSNTITANGNTVVNGAASGSAALTVNPATNKSGVIVNGNGTQPAVAINSTGAGRAIEVQSNNNVFLGGLTFGAPNVSNTTFMHDVQIDGNLLLTGTASLAVSTTASPALSGRSIQNLGIGVRGVTHPTATNVPGAGVLGIALDPTPADGSPESSSDPTAGVPNPTVNAGVNGYVENDKYFGGVFMNSNKLNTNLLNDQATAIEALAHDNGGIGTTGRGILVTQPNNPDQLWTGVEVANTNNASSRIRRAIFVNSNGGTIDTGIVVDPVIYGIDVQAGTTAATDDYGLRVRPTVFTVGGQTLNEGIIVEGTNGTSAQITRGITVNSDATGAMTHGMRIGTAPSQSTWNGTNTLGATSNAPVVGIDARFRGGNALAADPAGSTSAPFGMRVNTVNNGGAGFVGGDAVANTLNEGAVLEATNVGVRVGTQYNTLGGSTGGVTPTTGANMTVANNGTGATTTTLNGGNTLTMGYQAINVNGNITTGANVQTTGAGNIHIGYQANSNTTIDTAAELVSNGAMAKGVNIRSLASTIGTGVNVQTSSTNAITGAGVNIQSYEANINQGVVIQATGPTLGTVGNGVTVFAGKTTAGTAITNGVLVNNATGSTITNGVQVGNNTAVSGAIGNGLWVNNGSSPGSATNVITNGALIQTSGNNAGILTGFSTTTGGTNSNIGTGVNVSTTTGSSTISTIGTGINVTTASAPAAGTNTIGTGINVQNTGTLARIGTGINVQTNTGAISTGIAVTNAATAAAEAIGTGISVTNTGAPGGATQLINTGVNVSTSGANSAIGTGLNVSTAGAAAAITNGVTVSASGGLTNAATFTTTGGNITNGVYVFPVANGNITNNGFEALTTGTGTIGTGLLVQSQNANVSTGVNVTTNGTGTVLTGVNVGNVDNAGTGVVVNAKNANNGVGVNIGNLTKMSTGVRALVQSNNAAAASFGAVQNGGVVADNTTAVGTAVNQSVGVIGAMTGGTSTFAQMTTISAPLSFTDFSAGVAGDGSAAATNERPGVIAVTSSPLSATNNNSNNRGALEAYNTNGGIAVAGYSSGIPFLGVTTGPYVTSTGVEGRSSNTTQGVGMVGGTHTLGNTAGNAGTGVLGMGQLTAGDLAGTAINVDIVNGMVAGVIGTNGPNSAGTRIGVMGTDISGGGTPTTPAILAANGSSPRIGVYGVTGGTAALDAGVVAEAPAAGTGVLVNQVTSGTGVNANSVTTGTGLSVTGVTTGTGVNLGSAITSGNGVTGTLVAAASGKLINLTNNSTTAGGYAVAVTNNGTQDAVNVSNTSTGRGVEVANSDGGTGIHVTNSSTGLGLHVQQTTNSPAQLAKIENSGTGTVTTALKIDNSSTGTITTGIDIDPVTNGISSTSAVNGSTFTVLGTTAVATSGVVSTVSNTNAGGALTGASFTTSSIATQTGTGLQVTATGAGTNNGIVVNTGAGSDLVINEDGAKRTGSGTFTFGNTATTTDATNVVIATGTAAATTSSLTIGSDAAGAGTTNPGALILWDPTETAGVQNKGTVNTLDLTADRTWSFPDISGTIGIIPTPSVVDFVWYGTTTQQAEAGLTDPTRRLFDVAYNGGVLAGNTAGAIITSTANAAGNNAATGLTVNATGNANGATLGAAFNAGNTNAGTGTITGATVASTATGANSGAQLGLTVTTTASATSTGTVGGATVTATGGAAAGAVSGAVITTNSSNAAGSTGLTLSTSGVAGGNATGISNTLTSGATNNLGQYVKVNGGVASNIGEDIQVSGTGSLGIRIEGTGAGGSAPYPANGIIVTGPTSTGVSVNTIDFGANGFTVDWLGNANAKTGAGLAVNLANATGASSATGLSVSNVGNNTGIAIGMTVAGAGTGINVTNVDVQTGIQVLNVAGGGKGIVANVTAGAAGTAARFNGGNSSLGTALEIAGGAVKNTAAGTVADPRFADTYTTTNVDAAAGAATINNPLITATSTVVVTVEGATINNPRVTARVAGTSFTVNFLAGAAAGGDKIHYIIIQHP